MKKRRRKRGRYDIMEAKGREHFKKGQETVTNATGQAEDGEARENATTSGELVIFSFEGTYARRAVRRSKWQKLIK